MENIYGIGATIRIGQEIQCLPYVGFSPNLPTGPIRSSSRNVCLFVNLFVPFPCNFLRGPSPPHKGGEPTGLYLFVKVADGEQTRYCLFSTD